MADFNFSTTTELMPAISTSVSVFNASLVLQPTTLTPLITPTFSSIDRVDSVYVPQELGLLFSGISNPDHVYTPRRPSFGQLYPRGNQ